MQQNTALLVVDIWAMVITIRPFSQKKKKNYFAFFSFCKAMSVKQKHKFVYAEVAGKVMRAQRLKSEKISCGISNRGWYTVCYLFWRPSFFCARTKTRGLAGGRTTWPDMRKSSGCLAAAFGLLILNKVQTGP